MADWIKDGGAFTWLMLGMSVVALAFILERAWALRRARVMPEGLAKLLGTADPAALRGACEAQPSPWPDAARSVCSRSPPNSPPAPPHQQ